MREAWSVDGMEACARDLFSASIQRWQTKGWPFALSDTHLEVSKEWQKEQIAISPPLVIGLRGVKNLLRKSSNARSVTAV